jgi:methionyl-tRNA synthetase
VAKPLRAGQLLSDPKILFIKIEDPQIEQEIAKLHQMKANAAPPRPPEYSPLKTMVDIEDVRKLDLRMGVITSAQAVPKSKKMLKLQVDLGFEKRTIMSGIGNSYAPENLVGKKVVVVANLKPAKLMGVESEGMILCGESGEKLEILTLSDIPPGSVVS